MMVFKFIYQLTCKYRIYQLGLLISTCFIVISETIKPFLVKQLIDIASSELRDNTLWSIALYFAILRCVLVISCTINDYCSALFTARVQPDIVEYFINKLYKYPYTFFQNQLSGSITSKLNDVFQHLPTLIFTIINHFCYFVLLMVISLALMFSVAPIFAIILSIWVFLFLFIAYFSMQKSIYLNRAYSEEKANIIGECADYFTNMLTVKVFSAKKYELERFSLVKNNFIGITIKRGIYHTWIDFFLGMLNSIYTLVFIAFLILGYSKKIVGTGDVAFVVMTNFGIISTTYQLSMTFKEFIINWSSVDQALIILEEEQEIPSHTKQNQLIITEGKIVFDSVKFYYNKTEPIFYKKSVVIKTHQKVGLVGYSGSGKSTFVNLILKLYDISDGRILIDDQDISYIIPDSLRSNISLMSQDSSLFNRSIIENIRYGRITATDEEVIDAAKKAYAHEFITILPQGYKTIVGEKGIKVSSGQRQRIIIARAILKNAPILILDEATSQLDTITDHLIQGTLLELMHGKTTIVIAHRLSTLLHMDRILVFDKGMIIEDGTHINLLNQNGLYKALWDSQVSGFLPEHKKSFF